LAIGAPFTGHPPGYRPLSTNCGPPHRAVRDPPNQFLLIGIEQNPKGPVTEFLLKGPVGRPLVVALARALEAFLAKVVLIIEPLRELLAESVDRLLNGQARRLRGEAQPAFFFDQRRKVCKNRVVLVIRKLKMYDTGLNFLRLAVRQVPPNNLDPIALDADHFARSPFRLARVRDEHSHFIDRHGIRPCG
jgi:hypothetical protein